MPWDVLLLEEVDRWFQTLDAHSAARVAGAIATGRRQGRQLESLVRQEYSDR